MANNHKVFTEFNKTIRLTDSKRNSLKTSRTALRRRIRNYFDDNKPDEIKPKFYIQGSMAMDTIVNPIPKTIEIDGEEGRTVVEARFSYVWKMIEDEWKIIHHHSSVKPS